MAVATLPPRGNPRRYRLVELFIPLLSAEGRVLNLVGCPMWMHAEESLDNRDPVGQE